jgi:hypothetical protein
MVAILEREPRPLFEPERHSSGELQPVQRIIDKALRKERNERYQTAREMLGDLRSVREQLRPGFSVTGRAVPQASHQTPKNLAEATRRYVWLAVMITVLPLAVITGTIIYKRSATRLPANTSGLPTATTNKPYSGMSEGEQLAFVEVQANRISTMMGDRPVKLNEDALRAIKRYVDHYVTRNSSATPRTENLSDIYARATPYVPLIARSFAARKVPVIIGIYLPMIESAYRNCYENSTGAKGLYQFLPQTAKHYGVAYGEMCDVEKMTPAAAQYIADHMAELGDDAESMTLVLLSYNTGAEWVRGTLRDLRQTDNYERNFWTLLANRDKLNWTFGNESAGYVPRFFAAAIIGENPKTFNLPTPALSTLANSEQKTVGRKQ